MTVGELKKELEKYDDDCIVIVYNNYTYQEGYYVATEVYDFTKDNQVLIETDYVQRDKDV